MQSEGIMVQNEQILCRLLQRFVVVLAMSFVATAGVMETAIAAVTYEVDRFDDDVNPAGAGAVSFFSGGRPRPRTCRS